MAVYATHPAWGQPAPEWLSLQQAAAIYGVSVDTLRRRISAGKLPASRFGVRLIRVRAEDLDRRPTHSHRRRTRQAAPILTGGWTHLAALPLPPNSSPLMRGGGGVAAPNPVAMAFRSSRQRP